MIGCDDILSATGYDDDFDLIYVIRTIAAMIALACAIAMILVRSVATIVSVRPIVTMTLKRAAATMVPVHVADCPNTGCSEGQFCIT